MSKQPLIDQLDQAITEILANPSAMPSSVDAALTDLFEIARHLRALPRQDFKARLRSELERGFSVSTKAVEFRAGFHTITPYMTMPAADELIAFIKQAFNGELLERAETAPGMFHAEVRIGDSMLMIGGGQAYNGPIRTVDISLFVPNPDEVHKRALDAGAVSTLEMTEGHGERFGCVNDPFGNAWIIATRIGPGAIPREHTITPAVYTHGSAGFIDFMKRAFGAQELVKVDTPEGGVKHCWVKIGDSILATGDRRSAHPKPAMLYLYVPDVDAVYDQAIRSGAVSIHPPTNQPYGDRNGGVTDAWGNEWFIATPLKK